MTGHLTHWEVSHNGIAPESRGTLEESEANLEGSIWALRSSPIDLTSAPKRHESCRFWNSQYPYQCCDDLEEHCSSEIRLSSMLRKSNVIFLSYTSSYSLYCPLSGPISTSTPHHHPRRTTSSGRRDLQWRSHTSIHSGKPHPDQSGKAPWPTLPAATTVPTPYQIFCLKKGAPYSKRRFYELAKLYHPDRHGHHNHHLDTSSLPGAVKMERYRLVVAAHEILSDPAKRSAYDASGAGWDGRKECGIPKYHWGQNNATRWSGFDTNDSPFRNATWEDWERWYQRDKAKQEPVYFSNGGFLMLVITAIFLGGFGQSVRVGDHSNMFQRHVEMVHDDASKALRRRKTDSTEFGNKDERLQNFLKTRDPHGYGITDPSEEGYEKLLPESGACLSNGIHQRGQEHDRG